MSGIGAENPELMKLGLQLPGFLERARTLFAMPSLSLLTLAGMTPEDVDIGHREFRELPADAVAIGEGEVVWPRILDDFRHQRLQPRYEADPGAAQNLAESPLARYDLLDPTKYNRFPVQTSRGCAFKCEFCASSILLTPRYTHKPVERVLAEIRAIKQHWAQPFIELADDNTFADSRYGRRLVEALADEDVKRFAEPDISIGEDEELLRLLAPSGCRQILIGLESLTGAALDGLELRSNWKYRRRDHYGAAIEKIQSHGITLNGCFVLRLDGDNEEVFDLIPRFMEETALYDVQVTVQTAFPGTPLYRRLLYAGRLLEPRNRRKCTLFDVNFRPLQMTPARLEAKFLELVRELYSEEAIQHRHRPFFRQFGESFREARLQPGEA